MKQIQRLVQAFFCLRRDSATAVLVDDIRLDPRDHFVDVLDRKSVFVRWRTMKMRCRTEQIYPAFASAADPEQVVKFRTGFSTAFDQAHNTGYQRDGQEQQITKTVKKKFDLEHGDIADQSPSGARRVFPLLQIRCSSITIHNDE